MTASATVATAPLMAEAFDQFSPAALPGERARGARRRARDVARHAHRDRGPAAGASGRAAQLARLALPRLHRPDRPLARRRPRWALLTVHLDSPWSVAAAYAALLAGMEVAAALARGSRIRGRPTAYARWPRAALAVPVALALVAVPLAARPFGSAAPADIPQGDLAVRVLDVGQGDSILLDPPDGDPVLVDTGPPDDGVESRLRELGIDSPRGDRDHATTSQTTPGTSARCWGRSRSNGSSTAVRTRACMPPRWPRARSPTGSRREARSTRARFT